MLRSSTLGDEEEVEKVVTSNIFIFISLLCRVKNEPLSIVRGVIRHEKFACNSVTRRTVQRILDIFTSTRVRIIPNNVSA